MALTFTKIPTSHSAITIHKPSRISAMKPPKSPFLIPFNRKSILKLYHFLRKSNLVYSAAIPPEVPGKSPLEFPSTTEYTPPSVPPEVPESPPSPEFDRTAPPDEVNTQRVKVPEVPNPHTPRPEHPPIPPPDTDPDIQPPPQTPPEY